MTDHFEAHARLLEISKLPSAERHQALTDFGLNQNEPVAGWYRGNAVKDGPLVPIIITRELDREWGGYNVSAFLGGQAVPIDRVWPYAARNPVPKEWHDAYMQGKGWPDVHQDASVLDVRMDPGLGGLMYAATVGHNNPPADPAEVLRDQIEAAAAGVKYYATITDATKAGAAASLLSRLRELEKEAVEARHAESDPHHDLWKASIAKWDPIVGIATNAKKAVLAALEAYEPPGGGAVTVKGGSGRAVNIKPVTVVDAVTDWRVLIEHFFGHETLRACALDLAEKAVKAGGSVPGVTTKIKRKGK